MCDSCCVVCLPADGESANPIRRTRRVRLVLAVDNLPVFLQKSGFVLQAVAVIASWYSWCRRRNCAILIFASSSCLRVIAQRAPRLPSSSLSFSLLCDEPHRPPKAPLSSVPKPLVGRDKSVRLYPTPCVG